MWDDHFPWTPRQGLNFLLDFAALAKFDRQDIYPLSTTKSPTDVTSTFVID
jgi:hypothetical protein